MKVHSPQEIAQTLADVGKVLGEAVVIGGMAVIHHGYERITKDVDILYAHRDGKILDRLKKDFKLVLKAKNGWHHLEHRQTGVRLELIPEGGLTTFGFIPGPHLVNGGDGFISLMGLVWLKMVSGRSQDMADLTILAKQRMPEMRAIREKLPPEVVERYDQVLAQAQKELDTDPNLHDDIGAPDPDRIQEMAEKYGKKSKKRSKSTA